EAADGAHHVAVVDADDDDVVRVVRDGGGERAALQARAADEAEPDPTDAEVPLDDGDLREVAARVGDRLAVRDRGLVDEVLGHDLVRHETDHTRLPAGPRDPEVGLRQGLDAYRVHDPFGDVRM